MGYNYKSSGMLVNCCYSSYFYEGGFNNPKTLGFNFDLEGFLKILMTMLIFSLEILLGVLLLVSPGSSVSMILVLVSVMSLQVLLVEYFY